MVEIIVSELRLYCPLREPATACRWSLVLAGGGSRGGEDSLADLPRGAQTVHLIIPAPDVRLTQARLPQTARRESAAVLAYAVEEQTLGETEGSRVFRLGHAQGADFLAVLDHRGLQRWLDAIAGAGFDVAAVHCETLMLPLTPGTWSLAWNGAEGFMRTGPWAGAATDLGDRVTPPLSLRMALDAAMARPAALVLHPERAGAEPDVAAWGRALGIPVEAAGVWDWRGARLDDGARLLRLTRSWRGLGALASRFKAAAWIAAAALALHGLAVAADWVRLANEQRGLRQQAEARFRAVYPDAVAVADPFVQMRRKLAQARHAGGQPDAGDFLPLIERVAAAAGEAAMGRLRIVAYADGKLTLEFAGADQVRATAVAARVRQSGLIVEAAADAGAQGRPGVLIVRAP